MKIAAEFPAGYQRYEDVPARTETTGTARTAPPQQIINIDSMLALTEYRALELKSGRRYRVPPISGRDGVILIDLMQRLARASSGGVNMDVAAYGVVLQEIRQIARRLLVPFGWRRRLCKRLNIGPDRDPLNDATEDETGAVLGFLFKCRTTGPVRVRMALDPAALRQNGTLQTN